MDALIAGMKMGDMCRLLRLVCPRHTNAMIPLSSIWIINMSDAKCVYTSRILCWRALTLLGIAVYVALDGCGQRQLRASTTEKPHLVASDKSVAAGPTAGNAAAMPTWEEVKRHYSTCRSYVDTGLIEVRDNRAPQTPTARVMFATHFVRPNAWRFDFTMYLGDNYDSHDPTWTVISTPDETWLKTAEGRWSKRDTLREAMSSAYEGTFHSAGGVPALLLDTLAFPEGLAAAKPDPLAAVPGGSTVFGLIQDNGVMYCIDVNQTASIVKYVIRYNTEYKGEVVTTFDPSFDVPIRSSVFDIAPRSPRVVPRGGGGGG